MNFSAKVLMEFLLLASVPAIVFANSNYNDTPVVNGTPPSTPQTPPCEIRSTAVQNTIRLYPLVTSVRVKWEKSSPCEGLMFLQVNFTSKPHALCYNTFEKFKLDRVYSDICEERRCGKFLGFIGKREEGMGYFIEDNITLTAECIKVLINCEDSKELVIFKALTGLLLVLVLAVILLQFARPTYMALHKRFSQKRQTRWIGPTQSQSVSYHRNMAAHTDTVKRQSYPGLERLTVNPSREPSSNRNSDYESYGYH